MLVQTHSLDQPLQRVPKMHKRILEEASAEQLKDFSDYAIMQAKAKDHQLYTGFEMYLYTLVYGCHFSDWLLRRALESLDNEDGTKGAHWSLEETTDVASQYGIEFVGFDKYDWCYVLNMVYSDYYGAVPNDVSTYVKIAKKFILDKDAPTGKAFKYYVTMAGLN